DKLLKFDHHFHGWQDYVVGTGAAESDSPRSAGVPASTLGNTISIPQNNISLVDEVLAKGEFAAVILEPTGASWGTAPVRGDFLADLREVTSRHKTVLIFDEVVTGFRVSAGGAQARYGVTPDLTTLSKILAGGLPGGAVAGKADILAMLEFRDDPVWNAGLRVAHPGTFNANPLSAAAGSTMLSIVAAGNHHQHADQLNERLVNDLNAVLEQTGMPGRAYGLASYFHILLWKDCPQFGDGIEWPALALTHITELSYAVLLTRIQDDFGTRDVIMGALATVFGWTFGSSAIPAGFLTDRLGSRRVLVYAFAGSSVMAVLVGLSPNAWV